MMTAFEIGRSRWVFKLAPQLTGKAQQAYTALNATDATDYDSVKEAILVWYDINCETYRRRFRTARRLASETTSA